MQEPDTAKRVALVVGVSAYKHLQQLRGPENDAKDMAVQLRACGFDVTLCCDQLAGDTTAADESSLKKGIRKFKVCCQDVNMLL
jgi:uncharacterized caspase-like protein